jgi:MoxR-like ATPase
LNCPNFLKPEETVSKFKKSVGAPMCAKFGHVLGRPGASETQSEKLARHFAKDCPAYGEQRAPAPVRVELKVALPDPETIGAPISDQLLANCSTCAMCQNFVREDVVAEELGWTTGMCAAKGKLILSNRQVAEANKCEVRQFGSVRNTTAGIHLLPEYEEAFQTNADPTRAYFKSKGSFIDPSEYPSDKDVSDEDVESGIRAWRKVVDPDGSGREVFLPVYSLDFFSDEERAKIPRTGDDEHPELYVDHFGGVYLCAVTWTELDETPALWGEAGIGKTELYRHLAWLMCLPFERFSFTASTELDEMIGKMLFIDGETKFSYGRLPLAWQKPCVLCLDEPNVAQPDVWQRIRPLTDNSKQMVLDENAHELIERHTDCFPGMAMNPAWDPKNVGAQPIGDADVNRLFHVYVPLPPPALEREIIANRVKLDGWQITEPQLDMLINVAQELRALAEDGTLPMSWAIRPQIKVARALRWFETPTAYRRAVGDYLEPKAAEILMDIVKSHI